MIQIGRMRDRFTIERKRAPAQDPYGENLAGWELFQKAWGQLETLSGRQLQLAQADTITSTATHKITMRFLDGVSVADHRLTLLKKDGTKRTFAINRSDDVDNHHDELDLWVTEVVG